MVSFLEYAKGLRIFVLSKKQFIQERHGAGGGWLIRYYNRHNLPALIHANYSRTRQPRFRAPASIQRLPVSLMVDRSWLMVAGALWKHRALRSFQISQATKANKVSAPFCLSPCHLCLQRSHQANKVSPPTCDASAPRMAKMVHHT